MALQLAAMVGDDDVTESTGVAVNAESVAALRALGYLAGGGPARDRRDIDPKDMVGVYEEFVRGLVDASVATADERYGEANDMLLHLDDLMPDQYIVHYYFGRLALDAGDPQTAVGVLERALELNPSYLPTYTLFANALHAAGDPRASLQLIAEAERMFPQNFDLTFLGAAIAHDSGNFDVALAAYHAADRMRADDPTLLERLGHLHLLRREPEDAVVIMRRLISVTPNNAAAWAQLALGLAQTGDSQAARDSFDRALELDPDDPVVQQIAEQFR
jgi:tetratricopeptide (TPR) repeat protein